jgi:tRNA-guanine family transglycosylase
MAVGTQGAVKAMTPDQVAATGAEVVLANTFHLALEDRRELVKRMGGLHKFMGWDKTILTDSGGFQVFSLPDKTINDEGVTFRYERDGTATFLDPETSMAIQRDLGASWRSTSAALPTLRKPTSRSRSTGRRDGRRAAAPSNSHRTSFCSASCKAGCSTTYEKNPPKH